MTVIAPTENEVTLASLLEHTNSVASTARAEEVYYRFVREFKHDFAGVVEDGVLVGMVGRGSLGFLLGARFGFALYARKPIGEHMLESHTSFHVNTPILEVLAVALSRAKEYFYDDIAVVSDHDEYLGLISVKTLVRVQSALMQAKTRLAQEQSEALARKNSQLFRSLHELKQSQGRFEILFENSVLGVALLNTRGDIETCNWRTQALLTRDENGNFNTNFIDLLSEHDKEDFRSMLRRFEVGQSKERHQNCEVQMHPEGRGTRLFRLYGNWVKETGQICVLIDDITDQRQLERRIAQEERSNLLDSLAGGIAHEINNKLSPILGFTELLMNAIGDHPEWLQYCAIIRDSATESSKIIAQLLQMSRPSVAPQGVCNLHDTVEGALAVLRPKFQEVGILLECLYPDEPIGLRADPAQIKQVLINLLINAIHAMEGREIRRIRISASLRENLAELRISDTGHGISAENMKRILDPFFTTKGPHKGTGLGLSVSHTIMKQHGGDLQIESQSGVGTTIILTISRTDYHTAPASDTIVPFTKTAVQRRCRILVVDDEEYITSLTQEILRSDIGCEVECTTDGLKAIALLQNMEFDLIISDVRMGGLNGIGLHLWVVQNRPQLKKKFFFITGDAGGSEMDRQIADLGVAILRKPFRMQEMIHLVLQHLPTEAVADAPTAAA